MRSVGVGPTKDQRLAPAGPITVLINALIGRIKGPTNVPAGMSRIATGIALGIALRGGFARRGIG